ncbi:acyloxyacyl hydrolase [Oricola thermophila]|uniref:Acyloxyacyl hydrolase n=1 Tax=Oricola thermophila TaxID=2742145 RepID=A0A6N1VII3_9HYPH|nr:acyloxyacyl hydrolase [Oricola thermophila]QKV19535.1 acyloxyacyl hydrolase [Oricola thermophila]
MNIPRTVAALSAMTALVAASGAVAGERLHSEWPWIGKNAEAMEIRFGGAFYDTGPATRHDEDGFVVNGEVLLPSPALLSGIGSPRPYVGADLALVEDGAEPVHVVYAGLNWQAHWSERFYTSASLGGSYNTADLSNPSPNHGGLGCNWLFHVGISAGFDISERVSVEAYGNHFSNANQCFSNGGLESAGMRVGLRF